MNEINKRKPNAKQGWKILFKYIFEYKKEIIFLSLLGVISAITNGASPYIIGRFFDAILDGTNIFLGTQAEMPLWFFLIIVFAITQLIADVVDWINSIKSAHVGLKMHAEYQMRSSNFLLRLPLSFHKNQNIGEVFEKINMAANQMSNITEKVILRLAPHFLSIVIGLGICFWINIWLSLILIAGILIYVIILSGIIAPTILLTRKGNKYWSIAYGDALESVLHADTVKKFTAEEYERDRIEKKFRFAMRFWNRAYKIWSDVTFYQRGIVTITRIALFVVSVFLIQKGSITIGELIALNGYAAMVFRPFASLGMNWQTVQNGIIRLESTEKILEMPTEDYTPKDARKLARLRGDVTFDNVSFYYKKGDGNVLKEIDFKVKAGEIVALVGESGVGKSTLIELLSGYFFAQKGRVLVDGVNVKKLNLNFLRKNIAVVPQEIMLFNDTIKTNIRYGNFKASEKEIADAAKKAHADVFIEKFPKKYSQIVGERGVKLSVGQKQRIAIARAILRDPRILILDEPTSALDPKTEKLITESMRDLMRGRTTFIIAHRLSTVREADRILVFDKGRLVEEGSHDELMRIPDGIYKNLYELHMGLS